MTFDGKAFGEEIVGIVQTFVEREVAPLKAENAELRARLKTLEDRPPPEKGEPGAPGIDGLSPEPKEIADAFRPAAEEIVAEAVAKAVAALPPPEKGEPGAPGERGEKGDDGRNGRDGNDGEDGRGVKDLLIDRGGNLIATMDDGTTKSLGPVCGKDGEPGKDGRDGFNLTDFDAQVLEDDRTIEFKFVSGEYERIATLKWPTMIYRGVYTPETQYERGDVVSWGGAMWFAERVTNDKPDGSKSGWKLAVKKGMNGRDAPSLGVANG